MQHSQPASAHRGGGDATAAVISPARFDAVIFDLDGVITRTATVHAKAWKTMFDDFLQHRGQQDGQRHPAFDIEADYLRHVDGKLRYDGVQSFLDARGIHLPRGDPSDPPSAETVCGLGNRKDALFREVLERDGAQVFDHALELVERLRAAGIRTAVVSSSRNCVAILESVGALGLFEVKVDGIDSDARGLAGKPAPDIFLAAAEALQVAPPRAAVLEDALAGVAAGRAGGFGLVIGVDRTGQAEALRTHGADVVVDDLAAIEVRTEADVMSPDRNAPPAALDHLDAITALAQGRRLAVFLDFDGTLAPIVERPELAAIDPPTRAAVERLARMCPVAVVSGRDLADVRARAGIEGIHYAGSHGFEIAGPGGLHHQHPKGIEALPSLDAAEHDLRSALEPIGGALVERKRFSIAAHYRLVAEREVAAVERAVDEALARHRGLRKSRGKKVFELQPDVDWDKGAAVRWLLRSLGLDRAEVLPIYIGDDTTDEDALRALAGHGLGIAVFEQPRATAAQYRLRDPDQVRAFLDALAEACERRQ